MVWDARCQPQMCQRTGMSFQGPVLIVPVSAAVKLSRFNSHICCVSTWDLTPLQTHSGRHQLNRICGAGCPQACPTNATKGS